MNQWLVQIWLEIGVKEGVNCEEEKVVQFQEWDEDMEQHLGMNCRLEMLTRVNPSNLKDLKEDLDFELRMKIDVKMKNVKMTQIL